MDLSATEFLENASYAIVVFDEYDEFDKNLIDLVPTSWISVGDDDECWCKYPPIEMARIKLTKWLKELKKPDVNWASHHVTVKYRAYDYKQGLRRLQRAFKTAQAVSESEDSYKPSLRSEMVHEEIQAILNESSSLNNGSMRAKEINIEDQSKKDFKNSQTSNQSKVTNNANLSLKRTAAAANLNADKGPIPKRSQKENLNDKLSELKSKMTPEQQIVIEYMELKFESIGKQITSAKRSILYDMSQKYQTHSSHKSNNSAAPTDQADESWQAKIGVSFPIEELPIFLSFDEDLKANIEKRNAVKTMFHAWTRGGCEYDKDIKKIMSELLKKEIQILYSGVGRVTKGVGKENFSATEVFSLIREFIENKYSDQKKTMKIISVLSTYLSGAGDREGGRLTRKKD